MYFVHYIFTKKNKSFFWIFFIFLLCAEFYFFKHYVFSQIINFYPSNFDQASYLWFFYHIYENIKHQGLIFGLSQNSILATGIFFPYQTVLFFLILGASRWSALLVNFIYFIILQFICVKLINSFSKTKYLPLFFLGFLFLFKTPAFDAGGIADIRMDFIAYCLYGIFICTVIKSEFFLNKNWTFVTSLVASLLIFLRTLTLVYLVGLSAAFFIYLIIKKWRGLENSSETNTRLTNLVFFGAFISIFTVPFIWMNRDILYKYYVIGHILGEEKYIRAAQLGLTDNLSAILFYPRVLLFKQIGWLAIYLGMLLTSLYIFLYFISPKKPSYFSQTTWQAGFVFLLLAILMPLLILTFDTAKSIVVGNIMVIPTLWLICWAWLYMDSKIFINRFTRYLLTIFAIIVFISGINRQFQFFSRPLSVERHNDLVAINKMYMDIGDYVVASKKSNTLIAFDYICDYLTANGIAIIYYEKKGIFLDINPALLGRNIFSINKEKMDLALKDTTLLIINLKGYASPIGYVPFNDNMEVLRPLLKTYAEKHFAVLGDYHFFNSTYRVYVKPV